METKAVLETETQLPFAVDAAVLEQVAQFRRQQQAALQFVAGPGTGTNPKTGATTDGKATMIEF